MQDTNAANPGVALETEEFQIIERVEAKRTGIPLFSAHWHLFIPTAVITVLYLGAWIYLATTGKADTGLARLFIVVLAVGVPLLAVYAFLRYQTIRLQISQGRVLCHTGWPKEFPIAIPANVIKNVRVRRGLIGRLFGGGTVIIELSTGGRVAVADLAEPYAARKAIRDLEGSTPDGS